MVTSTCPVSGLCPVRVLSAAPFFQSSLRGRAYAPPGAEEFLNLRPAFNLRDPCFSLLIVGYTPEFLPLAGSIQAAMLTRVRMKPVAIIAALVIMVAALLFAALNRNHKVMPAPPMHQAR
jgi:hypothetical protein